MSTEEIDKKEEESEHIKELKLETLKSGIAVFLGVIISPISIFITIWLTDVLSKPEIKVIDANITEAYYDIELSSGELEYLKNDRYVTSVIQKFMNFGTALDINLAKIKWSSAEKLIVQKDMITQELKTDLSKLEKNLEILRSETPNWEELHDIPKLRIIKRRIRAALESESRERNLKSEIAHLESEIRTHKTRISDISDLFQSIEKYFNGEREPDNYVGS